MGKDLTHRERVQLSLNHKEPDMVPLDIGGTHDSTCLMESYTNLCRFFGIEPSPVYANRWLGSIWLDEPILKALDVDIHYFVLPAPDYPITYHHDGSTSFKDEWGLTWKKPKDGFYFDVIDFMNINNLPDVGKKVILPLHLSQDPTWDKKLKELKKQAIYLKKNTNYAVVLDLGVIPFTMTQLILGFEESSVKMIENPLVIEAIMDKIVNNFFQTAEPVLNLVGNLIDAIYGFADDLGTQNSLWVSPNLYRKLIKPYHQKITNFIKSKTSAKIVYHSCGNVIPFISDLIDIGIDALSPIQVSATDMDTKKLKKDFGDVLSGEQSIPNMFYPLVKNKKSSRK